MFGECSKRKPNDFQGRATKKVLDLFSVGEKRKDQDEVSSFETNNFKKQFAPLGPFLFRKLRTDFAEPVRVLVHKPIVP